MRLLRDCFLPLGLMLALAPIARAEDPKPSEKKDEVPTTIRGVVSDFTIIGESDIDETTGRVMTAEATLITVIGHPTQPGTITGEKDKEKSAQAGMHRHRMNLYVVALTPKTKVCEVMMTGKESSGGEAKEQECKFEDLEIGDRVELTFSPKAMPRPVDRDRDRDRDRDDEAAKKSAMKHGRHRMYYGAAESIKVMAEPMAAEGAKDTGKK